MTGDRDRIELDDIDRRIVKTVHKEGRITNQALSQAVGLSPSPCLQRFRRLEEMDVLGPYYARVDLDRVCRSVTVIGTATLQTHDHEDFLAFEKRVADIPEIVQCFKLSGDFDYLLMFQCPSIADYHDLSEGLLKSGPGLIRLSSHVVLDETKPFGGLPLDRLLG